MTRYDAKTYDVFVRDWWRAPAGAREGNESNRVPYPGAPREYLARDVSYSEARELCEDYNRTHEPGWQSRKAEFIEA